MSNTHSTKVLKAKKNGSKLLCFPECFAFMGTSSSETVRHAEDLDGPIISSFKDIAKKHKIWLSLGGFHEKSVTEGKVFNTHLIVNENGEICAAYRKLHLFKVDIPGGPSLDENVSTDPGKDIVVCDSPVGVLGLSTCYDVRFPELYSVLREKGAEILLIPSAFTVPTGKAHWEVLLRARAIENQCYVVASAQCGEHNAKRNSYGHSMIVDPWGDVLIDLKEECPEIGNTTIDLDMVRDVRASMPVFEHKKLDMEFNIK